MLTIFHNGMIADGTRSSFRGYVAALGDTIVTVDEGDCPPDLLERADRVENLEGLWLLPGAIDTHVHFREPGLTEKGDIASESRAARAGGVTSVIEMPNTKPATTTIEQWQWKMDRAAETSAVNYAFFLGATNDNIDTLITADYSRIPGVKVFMGSSTGGMLVDNDDTLRRVFSEVPALIAVHAEDETEIARCRERAIGQFGSAENVPLSAHSSIRNAVACLMASSRAMELAEETGARLHITHVSTAAEVEMLASRPACITAETCPQYLLFTSDDLADRGARLKCNPAIKSSDDRAALLQAVEDGTIDTIATDHAPHLPEQKQGGAITAASGMPGVQFSYPLMLDLLGPDTAVRLMAANPAKVYGIGNRGSIAPGKRADLVVASFSATPRVITDGDVISRCGWTPYEGLRTHWKIEKVYVNGSTETRGEPLTFSREDK